MPARAPSAAGRCRLPAVAAAHEVPGLRAPARCFAGRPRHRCEARPEGWDAGGAVVRELEAAGRLDTSAGLAAVVLAQRIAAGEDTGAGIAAMVKQLGATMGRRAARCSGGGRPARRVACPPCGEGDATAADA